ncbi:hypothetical protein AB0C34_17625 [Nocardia sp. NPDC049220]|uniref:hypothetical protein n=1 Tax=Nocardia sp. NPDC049220 TaxID=3155273 RepID=UPI0033C81456
MNEPHLWDHEHPYYSHLGHRHVSPADGGNHEDFDSWADFLEARGDEDPDYNLLVRWDWIKPEPEWAEPDYTDELSLFYVLQREGDYWSVTVTVTENDEPAIRKWLTQRATHLAHIWTPLLPTTPQPTPSPTNQPTMKDPTMPDHFEQIHYTLPARHLQPGMSTADGQDILTVSPNGPYIGITVYTPRDDDPATDAANRAEPEYRIYDPDEPVDLCTYTNTAIDGSYHPTATITTTQHITTTPTTDDDG